MNRTHLNMCAKVLCDELQSSGLKAYGGCIRFPMTEKWNMWTTESEGRKRIINEGLNRSPLLQIDNNYRALTAFLYEYEDRISEDSDSGSQWPS